MPAYLKLGDLKGDVQDARYKGWIAIESVNLGSDPPGGTASGGRGKQFHPRVTIVMRTGSLSPALFLLTAQGQPIKPVAVIIDNGQPGGAFGLQMENVFMTSYQTGSGSKGDGVPMDSFTLEASSLTQVTGAALGSLTNPSGHP